MRDAVSKYLFPPCERTEQNLLQAEWCWVRTPVKSLKQGSGVRKPIKGTRLWYSVCRETWLYIVHAGLGEFEYKSKDRSVAFSVCERCSRAGYIRTSRSGIFFFFFIIIIIIVISEGGVALYLLVQLSYAAFLATSINWSNWTNKTRHRFSNVTTLSLLREENPVLTEFWLRR